MQPHFFAHLMLLLWLPVTLLLFTQIRPALAGALTMLGGVILLPVGVGFDFPSLPTIDRWTVCGVSVLASCLAVAPRHLAWRSLGRNGDFFWILLAVGSFLTTFTNRDGLQYGPSSLPGMTLYDGISLASRILLSIGLPYFLARSLFRKLQDVTTLLAYLVAIGIAYSLLALYEIRMSPHLHYQLYGYMPPTITWLMVQRLGGYRPFVFTPHGLALATFLLTICIAAITAWKNRLRFRGYSMALPALFLVAVLGLCKSLGTFVYAALILPVIFFLPSRVQARIILAIVLFLFSYPALRGFDLIPTQTLVNIAASVNEERAQSLEVRFRNEKVLFDHASERLAFGWGSWGRNRPYNLETGSDETVTDGYWVILLGTSGLLGYCAFFGLLLVPVLRAVSKLRKLETRRERSVVLAISWMVVVYALDLLPNGLFNYYPVFLSGILAATARHADRASSKRARGARKMRESASDEEDATPSELAA